MGLIPHRHRPIHHNPLAGGVSKLQKQSCRRQLPRVPSKKLPGVQEECSAGWVRVRGRAQALYLLAGLAVVLGRRSQEVQARCWASHQPLDRGWGRRIQCSLVYRWCCPPRSIRSTPLSSTTTGAGNTPASVRSSNSTPAQRVPSCSTSWSGCWVIFGVLSPVSANAAGARASERTAASSKAAQRRHVRFFNFLIKNISSNLR